MTEPDLRALWAADAARLERRLQLDERVLRDLVAGRAHDALRRHTVWTWLQLALAAAVAVANGWLLAAVWSEPAQRWSTLAVQGYVLLHLADAAVRLRLLARVDPTAPVTVQQRALERLMRAEFRALLWALLLGTVLWVQLLAAPLRALGIDLYGGVPVAWVWGNVAFGVAVAVVGHLLARRFVSRGDLGPRSRWLVEAVSGQRLRRAQRVLAELAEFEREPG
ncbi:MAG: hypothetical protein AB7O97_24270 [Planctomycetota bacterium]